MARTQVILLCASLCWGCGADDEQSSDSGQHGDGGASDGNTDTGGGDSAISALTNTVGCLCDVGRDVSTCDTAVTMVVYGSDNQRLDDVTATVNGQPLPWLATNYTDVRMGLEARYTFSAQRGDEVLSEVHAAPSDFDLTLEPATPSVGMPLTVNWSVQDEPNVVVEVGLSGPGNDFFADGEADDGTITIPGTALDTSGSYHLIVRRNAYTEGSRFGSKTSIDLTRRATLTIE